MLKRAFALLFCVAAIVIVSACTGTQSDNSDDSTIKVSVTFNAMKEFVEAVGKNKVEISTMIPDGAEAHGFEPKAQDIAYLSTADIFVYNGLGMDPWAEEAAQAANNEELIVVNASDGADIIVKDDDNAHEEDGTREEQEAHADEDHGKYDPHLWLSVKGAQVEAKNIKDALITADPGSKDFYETNYNDFVSQLEGLFSEYSEKLQTAGNKNIVTGHAAFGYLCRDFGLVENSVRDLFAEGEPNAQQLAELIEYCRENKVTTVFAEEMASPAVSQTLATEVGAKVETIFTMETSENGKTYVERMAENLEKIYESLQA